MKNRFALLLITVFMVSAAASHGAVWPFSKKEKQKLTQARQFYAEENYHAAIDKLKDFLVEGTVKRREKRAYLLLGDCYERTGQIDFALNTYLEAVEMHPKDKDLLLRLGALYQSTELIQNSIDIYQRVLAQDSAEPQALLGLARAYMSEGFFSKAEEYYRLYFRTGVKGHEDIYYERALCYFNQRSYNAALLFAALSLEKAGEDYKTLFLAAKISRAMNSSETAFDFIDRAVAVAPNPLAALTKALWLTRDGEYARADAIAAGVLAGNPASQLALYVRYLAAEGQGKKAAAQKYLQAIVSHDNDTFILRVARARLANMHSSRKAF